MDVSGSIPFVRTDVSAEFEVRENGRVLVIKDILYNPSTNRYHDIKLERRGWRFFGLDLGGGGNFTGIKDDAVRQIAATYGIALKTLKTEPNGASFWGDSQKTSYLAGKNAAVATSYPFGQKKDDVLLSAEDAARFGAAQMTLHDAINAGIWSAVGWSREGVAHSPQKEKVPAPAKAKEAVLPADKPISKLPSIPEYRAKSTPLESGYDKAPSKERIKRICLHLDRSGSLPFSAFINSNREGRIADSLFSRMSDAIRRLAANPKAGDADAKYMRRLMRHWFRAAYHYLEKNSIPGDGYRQILDAVMEKTKDPKKAEKKAKEIYWRRNATFFWLTLIDLFAAEKIDIDPLHKALSADSSLNSWF